MNIELKNPDSMNILGLILKALLENSLKNSKQYKKITKMHCNIAIKAGRMQATISFQGNRVLILRGLVGKPNAKVEGTLDAFLDVGAGRNIFLPFLKRRIKLGGNIFKLIPLISIMKIT